MTKKRTLLIITIIYNAIVWSFTMAPLLVEQKEQGVVSRESVMTIALPAAPLMIIGVVMAAIAVSPGDKVNKKAVITGIVLAVGFMGYRLGMSIIGD